MADILSRIQQDQARQDNIDLGQASHDLQWANTFSSTPPPEVLRNRLNLADTMERVINNRLNLAAQSDVKALGLLESREKFKEWQQMAPLREELIKARTAATGATERRRAEEAALEADHTANLNRGISDLYRRGVPRNSPEFTDTVADLIANNPHAHPQHILEVGRFLEGETPDQKIESAGKIAAAREKARMDLQPPKPTVDEKAAEAAAITKARLQAGNEVRSQDPFRIAGNIRAEIRQHEASDKASAAEIGKLEKENPWLSETTGPTEYKGKQYFGTSSATDKAEGKDANMEEATPAKMEAFKRYVDLKRKREEIQAKLPVLNQKLDDAFNAPSTQAAQPIAAGSSIATKEEYDALPSGADFIWNGKKGKKP